MNRVLFILIALLLAVAPARAQMPARSQAFCPVPPVDSTLTRGQAARDNLWPGFGTGSLRQADMTAFYAYRTADIVGIALTGVGAVGLTASALQRGFEQPSMFSGRSNAPLFIFGGVALAGIATLTTSRILAVRHAREYDLILFPSALPGGGVGVGVNLQF